MARRIFSSAHLCQIIGHRRIYADSRRHRHREVLWKLTSDSWRTRTLPADNLDDPEVYLLAKGLAEVVDGRLQATPAGFALRKQIERER